MLRLRISVYQTNLVNPVLGSTRIAGPAATLPHHPQLRRLMGTPLPQVILLIRFTSLHILVANKEVRGAFV